MKRIQPFLRWTSLYAGIVVALLGMVCLAIAASGTARAGLAALYFLGICLLVSATPLLAYFFVRRAAKALAALAVGLFVVVTVWFAFTPDGPPSRTVVHQIAAIALCVLFSWRIGSALLHRRREKRAKTDALQD